MPFVIIYTTTDNESEAKIIAHYLVEHKLAACINIIPKITSVYRWKDDVCEESEYLLIIKTRESLFADVSKSIKKLHSYELPEVIMMPLNAISEEYMGWLNREIKND